MSGENINVILGVKHCGLGLEHHELEFLQENATVSIHHPNLIVDEATRLYEPKNYLKTENIN